MFKLDEASATIRPGSSLRAAATMPRGPNAKPEKVTETELILEISLEGDAVRGVEWLFPCLVDQSNSIPGLEHCGGLDITARTKLPEQNLAISYDNRVIFEQSNCPIKKKAKLGINAKGEIKLTLRPMVKATGKELAALADMINADVRLSLQGTQLDAVDMSDPPAEEKKPATRVRKAGAKKSGPTGLALSA